MSGPICWYESSRENVAREVFTTTAAIEAEQYTQRRMTLHFLDLVADGNPSGLGQRASHTATQRELSRFFKTTPSGSSFNMARAAGETVTSMVAQQSPLPIWITSGTDLKIARKAEKKTKAHQSQMNELRRGGVFTEAFGFCWQTGTGVIHVYTGEDKLPKLEAVNPLEMLVDHLDGLYRNPRSVHRKKFLSKRAAMEMWPGNDDLIRKSGTNSLDVISSYLLPSGYGDLSEMVEVLESWALPRGKSKGRHTICVNMGSLVDESYEEKDFPFAFCRYRVRPFGFWGSGLVESIRPNQERVNRLIRKVERGQDLGSNLYIFSPDDGENSVNPNFITTKIATIIPYNPDIGPPTLAKWDGTMIDLQQQIDLEFERVLRIEGISDTQVSGEGAGRGVTSAVGVRATDDVQSRRLFHPTERFEEMCLRASELVALENDKLARDNPRYAVRGYVDSAGVNFLVTSEWAELEIPDGQACLNVMKMNALPTTPQGKWSAVQEWIEASFITKPAALKLLNFPALDEFASLETAQFDLVISQLCDLLDGIPVLPYPRQSMKLALDLGTKAWAKMIVMKPDDAVIDAFEEYLDFAKAQDDEAAAKAAVAGAPPVGAAVPQPEQVAPQQNDAANLGIAA